jgi:hypothetical protein
MPTRPGQKGRCGSEVEASRSDGVGGCSEWSHGGDEIDEIGLAPGFHYAMSWQQRRGEELAWGRLWRQRLWRMIS